jgi:hypothetical protein
VAGAFFVVLAVTGSFLTTRHMNETATAHGISAGRHGEPRHSTLQDQSTTGSSGGGSASPASR